MRKNKVSHSTKFVHILNLLPLPQRSKRHFCAPFDLQAVQMGVFVLRSPGMRARVWKRSLIDSPYFSHFSL
jgi:hypothetical protein